MLPPIPPSVVELFKSRFSGEQDRDNAVPEETNGLTAIAVHEGEPTNERQSDGVHSVAVPREGVVS